MSSSVQLSSRLVPEVQDSVCIFCPFSATDCITLLQKQSTRFLFLQPVLLTPQIFTLQFRGRMCRRRTSVVVLETFDSNWWLFWSGNDFFTSYFIQILNFSILEWVFLFKIHSNSSISFPGDDFNNRKVITILCFCKYVMKTYNQVLVFPTNYGIHLLPRNLRLLRNRNGAPYAMWGKRSVPNILACYVGSGERSCIKRLSSGLTYQCKRWGEAHRRNIS